MRENPKKTKASKLFEYFRDKKENLVFLALMVILAIFVRYYLLNFKSGDYLNAYYPWIKFVTSHGGFSALKYNFSDQSPAYLYSLVLISHLPVSALHGIKFISIFFDFVAAGFVYLIVRRKYQNTSIPLIAFAIVLFTPTVFINSALWGQCDIIYTSFLLASVYFLLKSKNNLVTGLYAVALSFKLQAIFLAPLFVLLLLRKKILFRNLLVFIPVYLALLVPSALVGRPWKDLLLVYFNQAKEYSSLSLNAPTLYQWLPYFTRSEAESIGTAGIFFAAAAVSIFIFYVYKKKIAIDNGQIVKLALASVVLLPFVLPRMHERYFFPADVFSIIFAFYFPRYFYLPIAMQTISFLSYNPFLFQSDVNFPLLSLGVFLVIIVVLRELVLSDPVPIDKG